MKFTTAALCNFRRIWLKNWSQMAVRCRHGEWVAVKWLRLKIHCNVLRYIVREFNTLSTPLRSALGSTVTLLLAPLQYMHRALFVGI